MGRALLFVYGTLMRGEPAHALLGPDARLVAHARTEPRFTLLDMGEYPALLEGGTTSVHGELYEIDAARLPELDRYEDVPELYARAAIRAADRVALTYLLRPELAGTAPAITSGSWRRRA